MTGLDFKVRTRRFDVGEHLIGPDRGETDSFTMYGSDYTVRRVRVNSEGTIYEVVTAKRPTTWIEDFRATPVDTSMPFLAWLEVNDPMTARWQRRIEQQGSAT